MTQQILRRDVLVPVTLASFRFLAVVDGFDGADMKTAKAFRATMLPNGMAVRTQDVPCWADALAQPAGCAFARIAAEVLVNPLPALFPFLMETAAGSLQKLPCVVGFTFLYGILDVPKFSLRQPCPDSDAPIGGNIPHGNVIRDQPKIPRRVQSLSFSGQDFLCVNKGRANIRYTAGGNSEYVWIARNSHPLQECFRLQGKPHVMQGKDESNGIGLCVKAAFCKCLRDGA